MIRESFAGFAIGASVGLIVGLSVSPIAGAVVTTLLSLLVAYLGLGGQAGPLTSGVASARVVGFCLGLGPALLLSLTLRTHDGLSPTPKYLVERWKAAGFTESQAMDLAVYERLGTIPSFNKPQRTPVVAPNPSEPDPNTKTKTKTKESGPPVARPPNGIDPSRTLFFREAEPLGSFDCEMVRGDKFDSVDDRLKAMSTRPAWGEVVKDARLLPAAEREGSVEEQWRKRCGD